MAGKMVACLLAILLPLAHGFTRIAGTKPRAVRAVRRHPTPLLTAIDIRDEKGETALIVAAEKGDEACVRALLADGADATIESYTGWTALHGAAECGSLAVIDVLADAGADLSAAASSGKTPLDIARQYERQAAARRLTELGAAANVTSEPDRAASLPEEESALRKVRLASGAGGPYEERDAAAYAQARADYPALREWSDAEIAAAVRRLKPRPVELLTQTPIGPFLLLSAFACVRDGVDVWNVPPCKEYLAACAALPGPVPFSTDNIRLLLPPS